MSGWLIFWLAWGGLFAVGEGIALVRAAPGDTLSEQFWRWFRITPGKPSFTAAWLRFPAWVTAATLVWLFCHLLFGLGT